LGGTELIILAAMVAVTAATSAAAASAQNKAMQAQLNAQGESAQSEINELARQRSEANKKAQEDKSERARIGDRDVASIMAAMAEVGGGGTQVAGRLGAEAAGDTALDLARIEGNRESRVQSLFSQQEAAFRSVGNLETESRGKAKANQIKFFGDTASAAAGAASRGRTIQIAQQDKA
jgi:hypothetical protein